MTIRKAATYYKRHVELYQRPPCEVIDEIKAMRKKEGLHCVKLQCEILWFIKYCL